MYQRVEFNVGSSLAEVGSSTLSYIQLKIFHRTPRNSCPWKHRSSIKVNSNFKEGKNRGKKKQPNAKNHGIDTRVTY